MSDGAAPSERREQVESDDSGEKESRNQNDCNPEKDAGGLVAGGHGVDSSGD